MCGYVFVSSIKKSIRPIDPKLLEHRGPDFTEEVNLGWCRFRHWRLSIQDLNSGSNQPYSQGYNHLIYNGEIYDYHDLGLSRFSKNFDSDTQLLFHCLANNVFDLIKNESGFYSFVFIKESQKQFFASRDEFGKKPLYYYFDKDLLIIASEDRAVRDIATEYDKLVTLNPLSIAHYFQYKDLHFGSTFYRGIQELAPGSNLDFDFENWNLSESKSWEDYYYAIPFYKREISKENKSKFSPTDLKKSIVASIEKRFIADVPVQLALSGGVDSTLVALVAHNKKRSFDRTLTVCSSRTTSELVKSRHLCEQFGLSQKVIDFDAIDVLDLLRECIKAQGGPVSHPHSLAVFSLTKETAQKGKVLVTGEGADELMYGYRHYADNESTFAFLEHLAPSDYFDLTGTARIDSSDASWWHKYYEHNDCRDLDVKTHLLSLLRRNDRIAMRNSVEIRSAFLDFQLFQMVVLHQESGVLHKGKKFLFDFIHESYRGYKVDEKKIGFYVPFDSWFESQIKHNSELNKYIEKSNNFFDTKFEWKMKNNVDLNGKLAWVMLNIGLFLDLEGEFK